MDIMDHPIIRKMERLGEIEPMPECICPECDRECETLYTDISGRVLGCNECIFEADAQSYFEDQREARREELLEYEFEEARCYEV